MKTREKDYGTANVIGRTVEGLRRQKGIGQLVFVAQLQASGLDIHPSSYSKLEGQLRQATDREVYHIAKILEVPLERLFSEYVSEPVLASEE